MTSRARSVLLYCGLAGAVVIAGTFAYGAIEPSGASPATSSRTVTVARGNVTQSVSADGTVRPASSQSLSFATSGTITEIDVAAGDQVTAGQTLAKLDPATAQANLEVAQLNLSGANAKLKQAEAGTTSGAAAGGASSSVPSAATVQADQVALDDAQRTASVNANGYQLAVDQATAKQQQAAQQQPPDDAAVAAAGDAVANAKQAQAAGLQKDQQAVHQAQAKLAEDQASASGATKTTTTVDDAAVASAKAGVIAAQSALDVAQTAVDATTLVAPADGTITTVNGAVGDKVSASTGSSSSSGSTGASSTGATGGGNQSAAAASSSSSSATSTAFATLVSTSAWDVDVAIPEADAPKVSAGQSATLTVTALSDAGPLTGHVTSIASTSSTTNNVVSYAAVVSIDTPPKDMRSGMTASVQVIVQEKTGVLAVSTAAITTRAGTSTVSKLVNGKPVETEVSTGLQGDDSTEITSGVTAGDQLVIATASVSTTTGSRTTNSNNGTLTGTGTGGGGGGFGGGGGPGGFPGAGGN